VGQVPVFRFGFQSSKESILSQRTEELDLVSVKPVVPEFKTAQESFSALASFPSITRDFATTSPFACSSNSWCVFTFLQETTFKGLHSLALLTDFKDVPSVSVATETVSGVAGPFSFPGLFSEAIGGENSAAPLASSLIFCPVVDIAE
jgi:hypothetical protein